MTYSLHFLKLDLVNAEQIDFDSYFDTVPMILVGIGSVHFRC